MSYPDEVIRHAIEQAGGVATMAAKIVGCDRRTISRWLKDNPEAIDWRKVCEQRAEQKATANVMYWLEQRSESMTRFVLERKCGWLRTEQLDIPQLGNIGERLREELQKEHELRVIEGGKS